MYCTNCGSETTGAFCTSCGTKVSDTSASGAVETGGAVAEPTESPMAAEKSTKKKLTFLFLGVGLVAIVAIAAFSAAANKSPFPAALKACEITAEDPFFSLGDGDKSLSIDGDGDSDLGAPTSDIGCVLAELNVSDAVLEQMSNTSALMGVVSGSWDKITAEWTYHPDNGFDIILTIN